MLPLLISWTAGSERVTSRSASGKYYNIVGRIDDQVKVSGINISLDEVKNHINKLSQVKFCEFVRDQMDVFMLVGADTNTKESIQQMLMAKYPWEVNKHIKLVFCKNIPYNDRGKIDLLQARALHEQGEILQEVYEHLKTAGLSIPLSSFGELNLSEIDSLQLATLMLDFESKYRTSFSVDFLDSINQKNVNDLVSILSGEE